MVDDPEIARIANMMADPARARMLWMLIDGTTRPAGELAFGANISAQSASGHLAKLTEGGLLVASAQGRHRYFRLASAEVASVLEGLASLSAARPREPRARLPSPGTPVQFLHARTCYGHLAGETAVRILEAMLASEWLSPEGNDFALTSLGSKRLGALGVDVEPPAGSRRVYARACVDLTQRRPHLSGILGDAVLDAFVKRKWVVRHARSRIVTITPSGSDGIRQAFGLMRGE